MTEVDETGTQKDPAPSRKTFVSAPVPAREAEEAAAADEPEGQDEEHVPGPGEDGGPLMSRRAAISGVAMGSLALLGFAVAAATGITSQPTQPDEGLQQRVTELQQRKDELQGQIDELPEAGDAERGLSAALIAADQVAALQNDYRILAPAVASAGGELGGLGADTRRNLVPYFAPSVDGSQLGPWYLLASDEDVVSGTGMPMTFDSGFEWVVQTPTTVNEDGAIEVVWLAVQTRTGEGESPAVLAWARADYDITRRIFEDVETGTTITGEALRLEVREA